ncbi:hypothetical protein J5N97_024154 [Dioscorea zingiberensis]|uniref:Uncharacterized protein n=1 Tax=Dioscorea zingiberensis TaxID=325984 RepID=A0A9D5C601_9LILI|nr:hypothetical protein J5N97_024154 [Dioscorea zingiberensis]
MAFILAAHELELQPETPVEEMDMGMLKPSTKLTSKKSLLANPLRVISTRVAGGMPPAPLQGTTPEAQSPVAQVNFPVAVSFAQRVLGQNLPVHPVGAVSEIDDPGRSSKPVVDSWLRPPPDTVPGHTVDEQLFFNVNVAVEIPSVNS